MQYTALFEGKKEHGCRDRTECVKAHGEFWHRVRIRESCIWDPVHRTGGVLEGSELLDDRPNHWETG